MLAIRVGEDQRMDGLADELRPGPTQGTDSSVTLAG
jgi:hypothetical protein